jgi:hypothetical protein
MTLPRFTSGSVGRLDFSAMNSFFDRIDALRSKKEANAKRKTPSGRIVTARVTSSMGESHAWVEVAKVGTSFVTKADGLSSSDGSNAFAYPLIGAIDQSLEMVVIVAQYAANGDLFYIALANGPCACGGGGGNCYFYQQCAGSTTALLSYVRQYEYTRLWGTEVVDSYTQKVEVVNADMALIALTPDSYAWVSTGNGGTCKASRSQFYKRGPGSFIQYFDQCNATEAPPAGCIPLCSFCTFVSTETEGDLTPIGSIEISLTCFDPCFVSGIGDTREDWNLLYHLVQNNAVETYSRQEANCFPNQQPENEFYEYPTFIEELVRFIGGRGCISQSTFAQVSDSQYNPACSGTTTPCVDNGFCAGVGRCEIIQGTDNRIFIPNRLPVSRKICEGSGVFDLHECVAVCQPGNQVVARWFCEDVREISFNESVSATVNLVMT